MEVFNAICSIIWGVGVVLLMGLGLKALAEFFNLKFQYETMKDEAVEFRDSITQKLAQYEASYKDLKANYVEMVEQTDQALTETQGQLDEALEMVQKFSNQANAFYSRLERIYAALKEQQKQTQAGSEAKKLLEMLSTDIQEQRERNAQDEIFLKQEMEKARRAREKDLREHPESYFGRGRGRER